MITELMLITIAVGAAIVLFVGISSRRRKQKEQEQKEVADSTERFKRDLENTANEIISRMETQAAQIENLLDDTSRSRTQLEGRIAELKKLLKKSEGQSTEIKDLLARLDDAVTDISLMQKQIDAVELKLKSAQKAPPPIPQIEAPKVPEQTPKVQPAEFEKVLAKSIAQEEKAEAEPVPAEEIRKKLSQKPTAKALEPVRQDFSPDSQAIREMLLAGKTVEEVARETKLGRNAIELVQQMMRRQLERR